VTPDDEEASKAPHDTIRERFGVPREHLHMQRARPNRVRSDFNGAVEHSPCRHEQVMTTADEGFTKLASYATRPRMADPDLPIADPQIDLREISEQRAPSTAHRRRLAM
jgi:hypothetical protein